MAVNGNKEKRDLAFKYWRNYGKYHRTYEDVADYMGVSVPTISKYAKLDKWRDKKFNELNQINEEIKRKQEEEHRVGCEFITSSIESLFADYVRQVLVGTRKISDDMMLELLTLSTEIQRGKYKSVESTSKADSTLSDFIGKLGQVIINDK